MRLAFMGTPDFAVTALDALVAAGHEVAAVYTQPPRPANRGRLTASPVQLRAEALGLAVRSPVNFKAAEDQEAFAALQLDLAVVAAYGLILPQAVLDAPTFGCLNIHASLLPRWRGAAPVQRAILAGDAETGVTIMRMERGLDTGAMIRSEKVAIGRQTAGELTAELSVLGGQLMQQVLANFGAHQEVPQPGEGVTYAHKIDKAEARIDWGLDAARLERLVRAMQPSPGAWFDAGGVRVKLIAAEACSGVGEPGTALEPGLIACSGSALRLLTVQAEGKARMPADAWWRGCGLRAGDRLP